MSETILDSSPAMLAPPVHIMFTLCQDSLLGWETALGIPSAPGKGYLEVSGQYPLVEVWCSTTSQVELLRAVQTTLLGLEASYTNLSA